MRFVFSVNGQGMLVGGGSVINGAYTVKFFQACSKQYFFSLLKQETEGEVWEKGAGGRGGSTGCRRRSVGEVEPGSRRRRSGLESWRAEAAESRGGEVQGAPAEQMPSSALRCLQSCHDRRAGNTSVIV